MDILLVDDSIPFDGYTPSNQPLGGVEKAFARLPLALRRRGHKVRVINRCAFPIEIEDVPWQPWDTTPPDECDVLIAHRKPALLDFPVRAAKRILWLGAPAGAIRQDANQEILARHSDAPIVFNGAAHHVGCPIDLANRAVTIEPGVSGQIVPLGDTDAMAAAIEWALADPVRLAAMGARSHEIAKESDFEVGVESLERKLDELAR